MKDSVITETSDSLIVEKDLDNFLLMFANDFLRRETDISKKDWEKMIKFLYPNLANIFAEKIEEAVKQVKDMLVYDITSDEVVWDIVKRDVDLKLSGLYGTKNSFILPEVRTKQIVAFQPDFNGNLKFFAGAMENLYTHIGLLPVDPYTLGVFCYMMDLLPNRRCITFWERNGKCVFGVHDFMSYAIHEERSCMYPCDGTWFLGVPKEL